MASDEEKLLVISRYGCWCFRSRCVVGASVVVLNASVYNVVVDESFVVEVAKVEDVSVVYGSVVVVGAYDILVF